MRPVAGAHRAQRGPLSRSYGPLTVASVTVEV